MTKRIRAKERDTIIQSLRAGVSPSLGLQHIQVGRIQEVRAIKRDIERVADGGSAFRLVVGEFGSGKTFFLQLIRSIALEKKLVTASADLSPDRRIHASKGQARNLYCELMRNISTRTKPDGNAIVNIVEKFISNSIEQAKQRDVSPDLIITEKLAELADHVGGYDFTHVIRAYYQGYVDSDEIKKTAAIRWLRAEYTTKTQAVKSLGVRTIISDVSFYDSLKLMGLFVTKAGYSGLLVSLDEMVNLYKLNNTKSRTANYEQLLRILNDCLQGHSAHIGFILGGTPEFLTDERKGLFSYEALRSRLSENNFAKQAGVPDYSSPALKLSNLTPEELFVLLKNIRNVFSFGDPANHSVSDEGLESFLNHCNETIGSQYFKTPRNTIRSFIDLLTVLDGSPHMKWEDLIRSSTMENNTVEDGTTSSKSDSLAEFSL